MRRRAARVAALAALPVALIAATGAPLAGAAPISLVRSINASTGDSTPSPVVTLGGKGYFFASASGGTHDATQDDLYVTDGTSAGTSVAVPLPHPSTDDQPEGLVVVGSTIYFSHRTTSGSEPQLWSSNGTAGGTQAVSGLTVSAGTDVHGYAVVAASGTDLYFTGSSAQDPLVPAFPDQTLYRLHQGSTSAQVIGHVTAGQIGNVTPVSGGKVFFTTDTPTDTGSTRELWVTDGVDDTPAHTTKLAASAPFDIAGVGSRLYFLDHSASGAPDNATELWTSDGTTTEKVDFGGGSGAPVGIGGYVATGNAVYVTGFNPAPGDPGNDPAQPIWRVQGTTTTAITDGTALPGAQLVGSAGNALIFTAGTAPTKLYALSGSTATAVYTLGAKTSITRVGTDGTSLFFTTNGTDLYGTNGAAAALLTNAYEEVDNTLAGASFSKVGSTSYFDNRSAAEGAELWATGGTSTTTRRVKDINAAPQDSDIGRTITFDGKAYFTAKDGSGGDQLWSSDGTTATQVSTLRIAGTITSTVRTIAANAHGIALATDTGLWWSDGTTARRIQPTTGTENGFVAYNPVAFGNLIAFDAPDSVDGTGFALWVTDGTDAGTHRVIDTIGAPGDDVLQPTFTVAGTQLYFTNWDAAHGYELWHSDGTAGGTGIVRDIVPGTASPIITTQAAVGDHLVFGASDADGIQRMWQTNASGTGAKLLTSAAFAVPPSFIVAVGSDVFFAVNNQLWRVDGQADLCPFVAAQRTIVSMVPFGNGVAFIDMSGALSVSGGTADTTATLHQFAAGGITSPILATSAGLWFGETDNTSRTGEELWHSDGTVDGTKLVGDLAPNAASSVPHGYGVAGTSLVWGASDGARGEQLYGTALGAPVAGPSGTLPACKAPEATPIPTPEPTAAPTPTPVVAPAPTPTPAPVAKVKPVALTAKVGSAHDKKSPYLYTFKGLLTLPAGADPKQVCIGNVAVHVKSGKTVVISKSVAFTVSGASCAYTVTVKLPKKSAKKRSGSMTATLSFSGSARLDAAKSPKAITLRYGR